MEMLRQRIAERGKGSEQMGTAEQRRGRESHRSGEALISTHGEGTGRQSDDEQRQSEDVQGDGGARLSGA